MSFTGKNFPNISVDAIDYLGDNFTLNLFEKAQKENKKVLLFWYPKDFTFRSEEHTSELQSHA